MLGLCKQTYRVQGPPMEKVMSVRERMIEAGESLLAQRGYGITLLEVREKADTPRGSIYYHFPDGKEQLAIEVARKVTEDTEQLVATLAQKNSDPLAFLQGFVDHFLKRLVASDFVEGCPILGMTVSVDIESPALREALSQAFERYIKAISSGLRAKGLSASSSTDIATTVISAVEGALVVCRATHRAAPLKRFRSMLPALLADASTI
jgi:TetR/AcrR family transcriptional repressor of lmrAB and yxaGH operons